MANTAKIHPILLAGGSGTRLWPSSRKAFPKQFGRFGGDHSLYQQALMRVQGPGFADPLVLTGEDFRFLVSEQATAAQIDLASILVEPAGRDTAPAILAAALVLQKTAPDALMLVAAADHVIPDVEKFQAVVQAGAQAASAGSIVTFGIAPTRPETGYGWLQLPSAADAQGSAAIDLVKFVEKPDAANAQAMLDDGAYLWNSGIFLFSVSTILAAFDAHAAAMVTTVQEAVAKASEDLDFTRLEATAWDKAQAISIDFAVMEKADNLKVVPFDGQWSDLGDWQAVWRANASDDPSGNLTEGDAETLDCENTYLHSSTGRIKIVGLGLKDVIAVATDDAVLVADKSRTQEVKKVVENLRAKEDRRADSFPADQRPWGSFESLAMGARFQVKRIVVKPGGILSLQSHVHRAEHWVVVEGTARVTVGEEVKLLQENQSVYIPLGEIHRLENPGKVPLTLIEVQTGAYLGEDDIVRYEDAYKRT